MKLLSQVLTTTAGEPPKSSAGILWLSSTLLVIWWAVNPHDYFNWYLKAATALIGLAVPAAATSSAIKFGAYVILGISPSVREVSFVACLLP